MSALRDALTALCDQAERAMPPGSPHRTVPVDVDWLRDLLREDDHAARTALEAQRRVAADLRTEATRLHRAGLPTRAHECRHQADRIEVCPL